MTVRAPMLLDAQMNELRRLEPASLPLAMNLSPPSTADMTVTLEKGQPIPMRAWIRLYAPYGEAGIFRVSASETEYDAGSQRLTLEHGITSLRDTVIPPPDEPSESGEIRNDAQNRLYTAREMLSWLLQHQADEMWVAGTCDATENVILDRDGRSLFEMLLDMMDQLPEYDLAFDQSSFPWTVSIVAKEENVTAEGRLSRNLGSVLVSYDDSELCTRVYATGLQDGYMDADTQSVYGVVERSLYLNGETKREEATRIAERYLEKRKEPAISVEIDAVDLSSATGEALDAFRIGKKFRLTIPSHGLIVNQWITGLNYPDVYADPNHVTVTLANRIADISQRVSKIRTSAENAERSASGAGAGGVRDNASVIKRNEYNLAVHNEYIAALEDGISVFRHDDASLTIKNALVKLFTQQRDLYTGGKDGVMETLRQAGVTVDASKSLIELFASMATTYDDRIETNESRITIAENNISLKVSRGDVASQLAVEADNITLSSGRIVLDGYVTTSNLSTALTTATNMATDILTVKTDAFYVWKTSARRTAQASWQSTDVVTNTMPPTKRTIYYLGDEPSSEWQF